MSAPVPTEHEEEKALTTWIRVMTPRWPELDTMYKIPNEAKRSFRLGRYLQDEGLKAGMPDRCLPVARAGYHALYIEMKRRKGGVLSDQQRHRADLLRVQGNLVVVAKGWERASELILAYLMGVYRV